jgi:hypothetical protein
MRDPIARRDLLAVSVAATLPRVLWAGDALAEPVRSQVKKWVVRTHELCRDLKGGKLSATEWQRHVESLYSVVPFPELLATIDFDRLASSMKPPGEQLETTLAPLPRVEGVPRNFTTKLFAVREGRAIAPHGHQNMASMHVVLRGEFRLRHFERVEDQPDHLVLRPTIDRTAGPADLSSISDTKDNVHWLYAKRGPAFTFDVIVVNLDPSRGFAAKMDFVAPDRAERMSGGLLRAPRLSVEEAVRRYG